MNQADKKNLQEAASSEDEIPNRDQACCQKLTVVLL